MKRVGQTTAHKCDQREETEGFVLPEAPNLHKAKSTVPNDSSEAKIIFEENNAEKMPIYNFSQKLKLPSNATEDPSPNSLFPNKDYSSKNRDDSSRGLLDKMLDITGGAFEKFGNFLRGESTDKKLANSTPIQTEATLKSRQ